MLGLRVIWREIAMGLLGIMHPMLSWHAAALAPFFC